MEKEQNLVIYANILFTPFEEAELKTSLRKVMFLKNYSNVLNFGYNMLSFLMAETFRCKIDEMWLQVSYYVCICVCHALMHTSAVY